MISEILSNKLNRVVINLENKEEEMLLLVNMNGSTHPPDHSKLKRPLFDIFTTTLHFSNSTYL